MHNIEKILNRYLGHAPRLSEQQALSILIAKISDICIDKIEEYLSRDWDTASEAAHFFNFCNTAKDILEITDIKQRAAIFDFLFSGFLATKAIAINAQRDHLTGALKREDGEPMLQRAWQRAQNQETQGFGVIALDLDGFKPINDKYGHAAGDEALKTFVQALETCLRKYDKIIQKVIRTGGDEFLILIDNVDKNEFNKVGRRVRAHVQNVPFQINDVTSGDSQQVWLSIGGSSGGAHSSEYSSLDDMQKVADQRSYHVKGTWKKVIGLQPFVADYDGMAKQDKIDPPREKYKLTATP